MYIIRGRIFGVGDRRLGTVESWEVGVSVLVYRSKIKGVFVSNSLSEQTDITRVPYPHSPSPPWVSLSTMDDLCWSESVRSLGDSLTHLRWNLDKRTPYLFLLQINRWEEDKRWPVPNVPTIEGPRWSTYPRVDTTLPTHPRMNRRPPFRIPSSVLSTSLHSTGIRCGCMSTDDVVTSLVFPPDSPHVTSYFKRF